MSSTTDDDFDNDDILPSGWPTLLELRNRGFIRRIEPRTEIVSRPRVGQYYLVNFPCDAWKPEFFEKHPGIVIRAGHKVKDDVCVVVPVTSLESSGNPHNIELMTNPNPFGQRDGLRVWAVCDHIYTVHVNRLRLVRDLQHRKGWRTVTPEDMERVFAGVRKALNRVFTTDAASPLVRPPETPSASSFPTRAIGPNTLTLPSRKDGNDADRG